MSLAPQPVTLSELESVREQLVAAGLNPSTATAKEISKVVEVKGRRARTYQEKFRAAATPEQSVTHDIKGDTWQISLPKTRINTVEELIESFKVDLGIWEVDRFVVNAWDMGCVINDKPEAKQLYQIKAWLKRRPGVADARKEIESLKAEAKKEARVYPTIKRANRTTGHMLEISIPDLHFNKLAHGQETGWDNYDVKIAEQVFEDALEALLERTSSYQFDSVVLVVGNDLLHTDNIQGTTTAGTPQDCDTRFHRSFVKVREMTTKAIERLRLIAPVKVVVLPGNHDKLASWCIGDSLSCVFAKCPDVEIDNDPLPRKYHQFGNVMIMWTHGDGCKLNDLPLIMATEQSKLFGDTLYREVHTGHLHQLRVQEMHGIRVRISPALCAPDRWHSDKGYVGNLRSAEAFVWSATEGLIGSATYTVPN